MARKKNLDQPILPQIDDDVLTAKSNRISQIRDTLCHGSNVEFAQRLNSSTNYTSSLCNGQKPIGEKILNKILSVFPEVDKVWLFFGDGSMTSIIPEWEKRLEKAEALKAKRDAK